LVKRVTKPKNPVKAPIKVRGTAIPKNKESVAVKKRAPRKSKL
jgi:hypothetical protein